MTPTILLGLVIAVPALLIVLMRSDAAVIVLSLCAGSVLVRYVGSDASTVVANATKSNIFGWTYIGLMVLPAMLSIIALRKSVSSVKLPINLVTAVAAGLLMVLFAVPLLPVDVQTQLVHNFLWERLQQYQVAIIAASIAMSLVALWFGGHKNHGHKKHN